MKRLSFAALLAPTAALAHPGDHRHVGLFHFVTQPDHLAMIALASAFAALGWALWVRR